MMIPTDMFATYVEPSINIIVLFCTYPSTQKRNDVSHLQSSSEQKVQSNTTSQRCSQNYVKRIFIKTFLEYRFLKNNVVIAHGNRTSKWRYFIGCNSLQCCIKSHIPFSGLEPLFWMFNKWTGWCIKRIIETNEYSVVGFGYRLYAPPCIL